ncbi:hypothetical protein B1A_16146 [mine drainage metagenome]|uniref:BrnA antitoxin of type II toxin-antitoxin system n=1 Tax=mine drainage metagenome TaxID=410659 RepID=T1AC64_9ZZZZ
MSNENTGKTVRFTRPAGTPLSADERAQLAALKTRAIDLSDMPESPADAEWMQFVPEVKRTKQLVSLRLDPDVLEYFRHTGTRYQTKINQVLRTYMQAHTGKQP